MQIKNNTLHTPVMLTEVIDMLGVQKNGTYIDCTAGRGGHSEAILNKLSNSGKLFCIDTDEEAINYLNSKFSKSKNVKIIKGNFSQLKNLLPSYISKVDGMLADLGVSSPMFDDVTRGFSYHNDSRLDMRMDQSQKIDAEYVINNYSEKELNKIFREYGEVANPTNVVKNIIKTREISPIKSTKAFVDLIKSSLSWKDLNKDKHPAKVYFQALRIEVNGELNNLKELLNTQIPSMLNKNGRAVIISFHSLEDKLVKNSFSDLCTDNTPKEVPVVVTPNFSLITKKPITATNKELLINKRAHSAKVRGVIKNV